MHTAIKLEYRILTDLSACALQGLPPGGIPADADWPEIYRLALESGLAGVIFPLVEKLTLPDAPQPELLEKWRAQVRARAFRQLAGAAEISALLRDMAAREVPCLSFKGYMLAGLYPQPHYRFAADTDLLIAPAHRQTASAVLRERGYAYSGEASKENVGVWVLPGRPAIELHLQLWEDYQGERVERMRRMQLDAQERRVMLDTPAGKIATLGHTEHLTYLFYHLAKHMMYKGIKLRDIIDISLFVSKYGAEIDAARFRAMIAELGYERLCRDILNVCAVFFGASSSIIPAVSDPDAAGHFLAGLSMACFADHSDIVSSTSSGVIFHSVLQEQEHAEATPGKKQSRFGLLLSYIFPSRTRISDRYSYAKKCPLLLPAAWVHRICRLLFGRDGAETGFSTARRSVAVMNRRIDFLKEYNLMD